MDLKKYEFLVENKIDQLSFEQLKRLYKDIDEKVKQDSFNTFIDYNEKDTVLISKLDAKLNFIQVALSFAHVSRSNPSDIFATVQPWDNMIYAMLDRDSIIVPPKEFTEAGESYMGGFVKEPVAGRTDWVISVDLTALYPSIIMMLNMSAETLAMKSKEHVDDIINKMLSREYDTSYAHKKGYCIAANGTMYKKDKIGVIAAAMKDLFDTRKNIKDNQLKPVENLYEAAKDNNADEKVLNEYRNSISRLDALQYAYKILANSGYGAIGNEGFRYFRREIAEGITSTGQLAIKYIEKQLNAFINNECGTTGIEYVIYVDTDSNYFTLGKWVLQNVPKGVTISDTVTIIDNYVNDVIEPYIAEQYDDLAEYLNGMENRLIMKREAICDCAIFRAKKNYILNVYDNEHVRYSTPKLKMIGIETNRTSTPGVIRESLTDCIRYMVNADEDGLRKYVKNFRNDYKDMHPNMIAYPKGVNGIEKWSDEHGQPIKRCPKHVRAAITYNNVVRSNVDYSRNHKIIKSGSKIKYIDLVDGNPLNSSVIGYPDELPTEFDLDRFIDRKNMFEVTFMKPLESFTKLLNYNIRHSASIFNMGGDGQGEDVGLVASANTTTEVEKSSKKKSRNRKTFF